MLVPLALVLLVVAVANVAVGLGIRADERGVTDQISARLVRPGLTEAQVIDLLGSRPQGRSVIVSGEGALSCMTYRRRYVAAGRYRFCFRDGVLVTGGRTVPGR